MERDKFLPKKMAGLWKLLRALALFVVLLGPSGFAAAPAWADDMVDDGLPPCNDPLAANLRSAREAGRAARSAAETAAFSTTIEAQAAHPLRDVKGDIGDKYCIKADITEFFTNLLGFLTNIGDAIVNLIISLIETILTRVCAMISSAITSVLNAICLPLPNISLPSFSLTGLPGRSCNGISLNSFVQVSSGTPLDLSSKVPRNFFTGLLSVRPPKTTTLFVF